MKDLLLGIDIGTSACKVVVFDLKGTPLAQATESYPVYYPQEGWAEQNPDEWWTGVCTAIRKILATDGIDADRIAGIGVDGQSWSAIAIDSKGDVLCNTPIWMDTRAGDICKELAETYGEDRFFNTNGNPLQPMYSMPKVLWYKQNLPDVYANTDKILQSNSFIAYRLTGAVSQEPSQGYGFGFYNMAENCWDLALCQTIGMDPAMLPDIVACHDVVGTVNDKAAKATGLCVGTPVVAGGLDAACGTLGAGVTRKGQTQEQGGQAGGMSICMDSPVADPRLILGAHVIPDLWLLQGGTVGGGGAMNWFEREFGGSERQEAEKNGTNSFMEIDNQAKATPEGADGMVFLPYLAGERSPIWDANAQGVFYGVSFSKTRGHFARAVMEGVGYSLRHNLETAANAGATANTLNAMGGAANSRLWTQMKADITGCTIEVPSSDTATALGAAILAGVGTGIYKDFEEAAFTCVQIKRTHTPNPANKAVYDQGYQKYLQLYQNLKTMMNEG